MSGAIVDMRKNYYDSGMKKILLIEDDILLSRMYQKIFEFDKFDVTVVSNGQDGLEQARAIKPTIILLDIMMPKMNGLQVLDELKADPNTKRIPVAVLTNLAGTHDADNALAKGAAKYIIKSDFTPWQVADMVKEIIEGYTRDQVPPAPMV